MPLPCSSLAQPESLSRLWERRQTAEENEMIPKWLIAPLLVSTMFMFGMASAESGGVEPTYPITVKNMNVGKYYADYQIMLEEISQSVSKKNAGMLGHDALRWKSYTNGIRSEIAFWKTQAFLDLPVTHGVPDELGDPLDPECSFKDNSSVCQLLKVVSAARNELVLSSSADIPMALYPADEARQLALLDAMDGYIDHMSNGTPLDEPFTAAEERAGVTPPYVPAEMPNP